MLFSIISMLFVLLFLSIGYSAFVDSLSISDALVKVRPEKFTRIISVTTSSSSISNLNYSMYEIFSDANIAASETVTFNTNITTFSNVKSALSDIKVYDGNTEITNSVDITPDLTDPNGQQYIKICDVVNGNEVCTLNVSEPVLISITNNTGSPVNTDNFRIVLTFTPFYNITYNDTVIGDVLSEGTFTYVFQSNTPSSIIVDSGTCGSPNITGDTLTISNVTSDIVLTGTTSGGSGITGGNGTEPDPYTSSSDTYEPNPSDLPTGYILYEEVAGKPEIVIEEINGEKQITSFEYKDTSGVNFGSSSALDTAFLAFEGDAFTIDMTFDANLGNETGKYILSAFEENNGLYNGFSLRIASSTSIIISTYNNVRKSNGTLTPSYSSSATRITKSGNVYTLKITYDKYGRSQGSNKYAVLTIIAGQTRDLYNSSQAPNKIPTSLDNATITINGDGIDNSNNMNSITVYTFKVTRN